MIQIENVTKAFKVRHPNNSWFRNLFFPRYTLLKALDHVSFDIKKGEIFGLLGPNGAGKTTLINILCGLLQPTRGGVLIDGEHPEKMKQRFGVMLGTTMIYYRLTGYDNLKYFAKLYNVDNYKERIDELAKFLGLKPFLKEYVENYSIGMKSKLALARAMIHDPPILFLDEPTLGLDPNISIEVRKEIKGMGKTILLTTHYMEEADILSDRIGILDKGSLIKIGKPGILKNNIGKKNASLLDVFIQLTGEKK